MSSARLPHTPADPPWASADGQGGHLLRVAACCDAVVVVSPGRIHVSHRAGCPLAPPSEPSETTTKAAGLLIGAIAGACQAHKVPMPTGAIVVIHRTMPEEAQ